MRWKIQESGRLLTQEKGDTVSSAMSLGLNVQTCANTSNTLWNNLRITEFHTWLCAIQTQKLYQAESEHYRIHNTHTHTHTHTANTHQLPSHTSQLSIWFQTKLLLSLHHNSQAAALLLSMPTSKLHGLLNVECCVHCSICISLNLLTCVKLCYGLPGFLSFYVSLTMFLGTMLLTPFSINPVVSLCGVLHSMVILKNSCVLLQQN